MPLRFFLCATCLFFALVASAQNASPDSVVTPPDSVSVAEATAALMQPSAAPGAYHEAYHVLSKLNEGLPTPGTTGNLQTPQAALEHFVRAARQGDFDSAAQTLNLNMVPEERRAALAPIIARQLFYVMDKQVGFDWEGLPDRPDGAADQAMGGSNPLLGQPRRSLLLGTIPLDGRDVALRLQRVRVGDAAPVWVVSPQTVENVPALYERYGPGPVDRVMPGWARTEVLGAAAWTWLALALALVALVGIGWGVRRITRRALDKSDSMWLRAIAGQVATPFAVLLGAFGLYLLASAVLSMPRFVTTTLLVVTIFAFVWLCMRAISAITEVVTKEQNFDGLQELSAGEGSEQQRWLTYLSVGRRVLLFVVFVFGVGLVIAQFQSLEKLGFSLMASAGVATVLLGIAAQPVLGNIIASIQIALSRPVRIGDSVLYEGNWGYVEDITYTYVLIKTWDERRLVVPLRYFITHPFENWTLRDTHLIKPIYLHADYTIDVEQVREKFGEMLRASDLWDEKNEPSVLVTSAGDETVEIRALCSAANPSDAWDLHCELREKLVAYVRDLDGGAHLPRRRVALREPARQGVAPGDTTGE